MNALPLLAVLLALPCLAARISVDPSVETGPVKPVNGVGQPPMVGMPTATPMFHYLREAGIPYSRLHDVGGWTGQGLWVDIPNLFPDFDADENEVANYDFAMTDALVERLVANGVEPFFRLGVTLENFAGAGFPPKRIRPPKDFAKWARICEHVIRHYTEGWADGFRHRITHWEIWNEPDNYEEIEKNCMWKGTFDSYCDFYGTAATYLKKRFPSLKIGGYASCGFYAAVGAANVKAANSSPRMQYFVDCARKFLSRAAKEGWPLDFFSFHSYSAPPDVFDQVAFADRLLDEYGFSRARCARIFNEWLPCVGQQGTARQAAAIAAELIGLQNGPCDIACIYDAQCSESPYSPLFDPRDRKPRKAYYAFTAFNELRKLGRAVKATCDDATLYAAAAERTGEPAVMAANPSDEPKPFALELPDDYWTYACRLTDETSTDVACALPTALPPRSFLLCRARVARSAAEPVRVALTFDDALKDHLLIAAPELEKRGWRGIFTVVTDWIGTDEKFMTWDDVRELVRRGHEVATHSKTHRNLAALPEAELRRELAVSRDLIAEKTGFVPRFLCPPFVCQNETTARICREEGLRQMLACRKVVGEGSNVRSELELVLAMGGRRVDVLHHGISAADHGGWLPFRDRASFARHLDALVALEKEGKIVVTDYEGMISDCALAARDWPRHGVLALSFDDRNLADWERALPLFAHFGATATFCISGEFDTNVIAFARKALSNGHEIALHGLRHCNADAAVAEKGATTYWSEKVVPQLDACRAAGIPVRSFAYPNCRHTSETDELFLRQGFTRLRGSLVDVPNPQPYDPQGLRFDRWRPLATCDGMFAPAATFLSRRTIPNVIMGDDYHTDIEDVLAAMERAGRRAELLSLVSHGISPDARGISMKTEWLERMLSSARRLGLVVRGIR